MFVEALVAQAAVERFDVGILVRFARFNQAQLDAMLVGPSNHRLTAELLAVVAANDLGQAAGERQAIHHARHAHAGDRSFDLDDDSLVRGVIDNRQAFDDAALGRAP